MAEGAINRAGGHGADGAAGRRVTVSFTWTGDNTPTPPSPLKGEGEFPSGGSHAVSAGARATDASRPSSHVARVLFVAVALPAVLGAVVLLVLLAWAGGALIALTAVLVALAAVAVEELHGARRVRHGGGAVLRNRRGGFQP